jgi:prophage regulatory protein
MQQNQNYLNVQQTANRYAVSIATIWRWARMTDFPGAIKLGENCTRWKLSDLIAWEETQAAA